ncbi:hypothetical protein [Deinococcus sp.]|uniref:hypothetical protein n=1 Tax=Deinococcus sp. TaxID=47478 RepID=UPI003C7D4A64
MIEISPEEFTERHAQYAAEGLIYPQPEGSPLLEFAAGGRVLYLLDRCGPYSARAGAARVIVNGVLSRWERAGEEQESLTVVGVSGLEGVGRLLERPRGSVPTLVLQARLTLVLHAYQPLPDFRPGDWISFATEPLLHGFIVTGTLR